ncbi:MAG TPA: rod-binding protein [Polyangiales bacterium]|nr:rod-binding protein [Polyangiales bacterium]
MNPLNKLPMAGQEALRQKREDPEYLKKQEAAKKFEGILMQQLLNVMRQTAKSGGMGQSEGASGQYTSMFDEMIADKLADGGGIGLAQSVMRAFGEDERQPLTSERSQGLTGMSLPQRSAPAVTPPMQGLQGATAKLAHAAYAISAPDGGKQWAREGTLTTRDLASTLETQSNKGAQHFAVAEAGGYTDAFKCNLFAFEAARRAGFEVPVIKRDSGYGFPTSNSVTTDAQDGSLKGDWADVVSPQRVGELRGKLERGEVAVMLTGAGTEGRHGHMAVVEKIHDVQFDEKGELSRIEFDGYEARQDGAQHLTRRSWNLKGHGEDSRLARNGFGRIELLALRPSATPQTPEIRVSEAIDRGRGKTP